MRDSVDSIATGAIAKESMQIYLARGYTTLRDIGGATTGLANAVQKGWIEGPRIFSAGAVISGISGHGDWSTKTADMGDQGLLHTRGDSIVVTGRDQVMQAVRTNFKRGATQIKIMGSGGIASDFDPLDSLGLTVDEMKAAVEAAKDYGSYVAVHAFTDKSINRALDAGVLSIEHGFEMTETTAKRMVKEGAYISLQSYAGYALLAEPEKISFYTADHVRKGKRIHKGVDQMMRYVKKYGVKAIAGTDMYGKSMIPDVTEDLLVRLRWFTPLEILKQNTSTAGELLAKSGYKNPYFEGKIGVIKDGAYADLILVEGNPLEDLKVLRDHENKINLIMKDGKIYKNTL